jgi:iron(III) transport system substrate-binding protein
VRPRSRALAAVLRAAAGSLAAACAAAGTAACGAEPRAVLTVYSPHGRELLQHYEREFERAEPAVDVRWVEMGSHEVLERVRAESADPQADVWFGAPSDALARAAAEGLLAPYRPTGPPRSRPRRATRSTGGTAPTSRPR